MIIVLRIDFYSECAKYESLHDFLGKQQIIIPQMTHSGLRKAIVSPAQRVGLDFEPGLVDLLLRDVGNEPGALPLLSHALLETWRNRQNHRLTLAGYISIGSVHGAIAQTADSL